MMNLWRISKLSECEDNEKKAIEDQRERILIIGAGMIGLASAYYLSKFGKYQVTVIEKDNPIKGASEQNLNTICIDLLPVLNSMNYIKVIKENFMFKENPTSYLKFTLIFNSDFRYWLKHYIKSRSQKRVEQSTNATLKLSSMGFNLYDDYVLDMTDNQPDLVDYHQEYFRKLFANLSEQDLAMKNEVVKITSEYDQECKLLDKDILNKYKDVNYGYQTSTKILNTASFWRIGRQKLNEKYGVQFLQGKVNEITYSDKKIHSVGYLDENNTQHKLKEFEKIVFWGGIESIHLAKLVGLRIPIFGFKGHSLNVYVDKDKMPDSTYLFGSNGIDASRVGLNSTGMIRFTGFADVVENDLKILTFRKDLLVKFAKKYLGEENYDDAKAHHWVGLRPVSADDCPIIGQSTKFDNLYWNTGHGGRGVSQAISSALLLQKLMNKENPPIGLIAADYSPERFKI